MTGPDVGKMETLSPAGLEDGWYIMFFTQSVQFPGVGIVDLGLFKFLNPCQITYN